MAASGTLEMDFQQTLSGLFLKIQERLVFEHI